MTSGLKYIAKKLYQGNKDIFYLIFTKRANKTELVFFNCVILFCIGMNIWAR